VNYEWEEALFGIPLQSDDDSSDEDIEVDSDEDYFWKDQKVIVDGRLADPTSEQMLHSPQSVAGRIYGRQMSVLLPLKELSEGEERSRQKQLFTLNHFHISLALSIKSRPHSRSLLQPYPHLNRWPLLRNMMMGWKNCCLIP